MRMAVSGFDALGVWKPRIGPGSIERLRAEIPFSFRRIDRLALWFTRRIA
jgi:hypothetical protein